MAPALFPSVLRGRRVLPRRGLREALALREVAPDCGLRPERSSREGGRQGLSAQPGGVFIIDFMNVGLEVAF